jgi:hypothetical protein
MHMIVISFFYIYLFSRINNNNTNYTLEFLFLSNLRVFIYILNDTVINAPFNLA